MKVLRYLLPLLFSLPMAAQTSAFTATITDPDSQTWNNGTWNAQIYSPNGVPTSNGVPLTVAQSSAKGTMNGSGAMSGTLYDNSLLTPSGTLWRFTLCPNASAPCSSGLISVVGASPNLSTALSNLTTAPRFAAGQFAYGYADGEVSPTPVPGATYYNVSTPAFRQWTGSAWATVGGGGGSVSITSSTLTVSPSPLVGTGTVDINPATSVTWTANQAINTSAATGDTLTLTNTNSSNLAGIGFQSAGGKNFFLFGGGTVAAANYFGLYDATDSAYVWAATQNAFNMISTGVIGWTNGAPFSGATTGLSATAAATLAIGNGTQGDVSGTVKAAHLFAGANEATVTAATTVNAAVCLKSAGPPVVLGVCSTVVSSGGACTCN